jgi:hypothetical protein
MCDANHRFEGWFASPEEFDRQYVGELLSCPSCGSTSIRKYLMAKIGRSNAVKSRRDVSPPGPVRANVPDLAGLIDHILLNTEDVGDEFAAEARRMQAREVEVRGIRGHASSAESEALRSEGIPVFALPIPPKSGWH